MRVINSSNKVSHLITITLLFVLLFTVTVTFGQETPQVKKDNFITAFLDSTHASKSVKYRIREEYSILYNQYRVTGNSIENLIPIFDTILNTYKTTNKIDTSFRLFALRSKEYNKKLDSINELNFYYNPKSTSGQKSNLLGGGPRSAGCDNIGFENNNFDDWSLAYSSGGGVGNLSAGSDIGAFNGTLGNHAIMGPGAGMDGPSGNNVPRVYPGGGQYSMRVGDQGTGYNASRVSYTFTVTPQTELFLYHFAVIMQDPGHPASQQPFMSVDLNINGQNISCGHYYQAAAGNAPGFFSNGTVKYKPWATMSIPLTSYMGQTATVIFTTQDCAQGGHFGYAYIDCECSAMPNLNNAFLTCANPTKTLTAPPGADQYQWTGPGIIGSANNPSVVVGAEGTYEVQVIPVQGPSCSYTVQTYIKDSIGQVTADFNPNPAQVCFGASIDFNDLSTADLVAGNINDYQWDFGDGNTSTSQNPSHSYGSPGVYTVRLIIASENTCKDTVEHDVEVSAIPVPDFSIDSICQGVGSTIQDLSSVVNSNGDQITAWNWDFGDGQTSSLQNPAHTYGDENVYNVKLIVTTNKGCIDSISKSTAIYPNPKVDFSPTEVCLSYDTEFTDESTVSNTHTTNQNTGWTWDFDDGNSDNTENPTHTYSTAGIYNANLEVTTNHGCVHDTTLAVTVNPQPTADFNFVNACDNEAISLTSTSVPNGGVIADYYWDVDNNNTVDYSTASVQHIYNQDGFYTVQLIVKTNKGCLDTIAKQVTVYALPTADFNATSVCEDTTTTFANNSSIIPVDNDTIDTFNWNFGNGQSSSSENPSLNYQNENIYNAKLVVTSNYGCKDSVTKPINVYPLPHVNFTSTSVCLNFNTQFTNQTTLSNNHTNNSQTNWDWNYGDGGSSTLENPQYVYTADGTFNATLTVTSNHGCKNDTTLPVIVYPLPEVSFVGQNLKGCSPVCPSVHSTTTIHNPSSLQTFEWTLSDGTTYNGDAFNDCYTNLTSQDNYYDLTLKVTSNEGCVSSHAESDYIAVYHNPIAGYYTTPTKPDIIHPDVEFHNTSNYADYYQWFIDSDPASTDVEPIITFDRKPQTYQTTLIASTDKGCADTAHAAVRIWDRILLYVPNTFTPDHDNYNEVFKPVLTSGFDPYDYTLYIFNRWGELIFESHNTNVGWDGTYGGKIAKSGTYLWKIIFKESETDKHHTLTGHVNLLK